MTLEEAINQLEDLTQDRKSFLRDGEDDSTEVYLRDTEALEYAVKALRRAYTTF